MFYRHRTVVLHSLSAYTISERFSFSQIATHCFQVLCALGDVHCRSLLNLAFSTIPSHEGSGYLITRLVTYTIADSLLFRAKALCGVRKLRMVFATFLLYLNAEWPCRISVRWVGKRPGFYETHGDMTLLRGCSDLQ